MSDIIPMLDIIMHKNNRRIRHSAVVFYNGYEVILEESDVAPHTVCASVGIIGEVVHCNAT